MQLTKSLKLRKQKGFWESREDSWNDCRTKEDSRLLPYKTFQIYQNQQVSLLWQQLSDKCKTAETIVSPGCGKTMKLHLLCKVQEALESKTKTYIASHNEGLSEQLQTAGGQFGADVSYILPEELRYIKNEAMVIYYENFVSIPTKLASFNQNGIFDGVLRLKDFVAKRVLLSGCTYKQHRDFYEFLYKDKSGYT